MKTFIVSSLFFLLFSFNAFSYDHRFETALERIGDGRQVIESTLIEYGLDKKWLSLALAESGGKICADSDKGARGVWQLMPFISRHYGLKVSFNCDERCDLRRSTEAASKYIAKHIRTFKGHLCAIIGAYNMGGANLIRITGKKADTITCDDVKRASMEAYFLYVRTRYYWKRLEEEEHGTIRTQGADGGR